MQTKSHSDGTPAVTYTYGVAFPGCMTSVGNSVSSKSYTYGPECQVLTSTQTTGPASYGIQYGYNGRD